MNSTASRTPVESALAVNVGAYAPCNSAWGARVVGTLDRRPTAAEIEQITALLERRLEAGPRGVSAGLDRAGTMGTS
jgi:N-acyl-D-aspartate/D-glutamate deacylase